MANFLRTFYLRTITLNSRNLIRLRLILNTAIFLSVFALTASITTIYFENKIDSVEQEIMDERIHIQANSISLDTMYYQMMTSSYKFNSIKKDLKFEQYYYWTNSAISGQRSIYYLNFMELYPYISQGFYFVKILITLAKVDEIDPKKFKKYYEVTQKLAEFEKIVAEVEHDIATMTVDGIFDPTMIQKKKGYFEKYQNYLEKLFEIYQGQQFFITDGYNIIKKKQLNKRSKVIDLTNEISSLSNFSSIIIFLAFIIQFVVFIIIQILEISSARIEKEDL